MEHPAREAQRPAREPPTAGTTAWVGGASPQPAPFRPPRAGVACLRLSRSLARDRAGGRGLSGREHFVLRQSWGQWRRQRLLSPRSLQAGNSAPGPGASSAEQPISGARAPTLGRRGSGP